MGKIITYSFCENFIDHLTDHLQADYLGKGKDLSRVAVIFGGKRPSLFIKKELAKRIKDVYYPPQFFTIDEFIAKTLEKKELFLKIDDLDNSYLLYNLAREKVPEILKRRESFAKFLPWTKEISGFIDQLDIEKIENKDLQNIEANAQIGYAVPEDINKLLRHIVVLRQEYHEKLIAEKVYSRGLQYLRASEAVKDIDFAEYDQILFCNFFYFNRCEETIIKSLYEKNKATLIFQGDQRKWPILKRIARNFSVTIQEGETVDKPGFDLKLYSGFDIHSQMATVREILSRINNKDKTVLVLPEPNHIIPLLSQITSIADDFNVSMGYPLKRSSLYSLLELVFNAQLSRKNNRYYAKDYLKALRHPFLKNLQLQGEAAITRILVHKIEEILIGKERSQVSGSSFIQLNELEKLDDVYDLSMEMLKRLQIPVSKDDLKKILKEIHDIAFAGWESVADFHSFVRSLEGFLNVLVQKSSMKNYPLNMNIASKMFGVIDELRSAEFSREKFSPEEIFRIFEEKLTSEKVAFIGSPLKGLQILGLFETRSLSFENVIILDVNEGVLPRLNIYEPLIPREVMISLNLDRLEMEEEIQRYQFMRIISSAKKVHLVYQENKEKEKSRFVEELIWEKQKAQQTYHDVPVVKGSFEVKVAQDQKVILKTPDMIEALKKHTFSASSINLYLRNPMDFYYNYVLGLREQEDLLDEPDSRQIGTFVHELLEQVFNPYIEKPIVIDPVFKERFFHIFERLFQNTIEKSMKSDSFLLKSVLIERLTRFIDNEQNNPERAVEKILFLEKRFEEVILLSCGDIKFGYVVDRIDQMKDGTIMLLDYKTGSVDVMPQSLEKIAGMDLSRENIRDFVRSFQIPLYFHYLEKEYQGQKVNAALYNLRTLKISPFITDKKNYDIAQLKEVFLKCLDFILSEILDINVPFVEDQSTLSHKF